MVDDPLPTNGTPADTPVNGEPAAPAAAPKKTRTRKPPKGKGLRLLIVESPAKAKTINKFVGSKYIVKACMGHVRDLPQHRLGVDVKNDFAPHYVTVRGKGDLLKELKKDARRSETVYLATDPDREGEAICWHLKEALKLPDDKVRRVVFNEITKKVVKDAVEAASLAINIKLVEAQQARRILDRLVGYSLSPLLWAKVRKGLSAGRVQSVAVRIICDREALIKAFVPVEYWSVETEMSKAGGRVFAAKLTQVDGAKAEIATGEAARGLVSRLEAGPFTIKAVERREQKRNPAPPFTTSTMQQEAAKRYRYTAKRTMMIAQGLYEGVDLGAGTREGLITYMRTDSVRVSTEAQVEARAVLAKTYGEAILPETAPVYKGRASAQDAHEAVRPSSAARDPESVRAFLTPDQYKLYRLVWQRFLASQSAQAQLESTSVDIAAGPGGGITLRATGTVVKFPGFMSVYKEAKEEGEPQTDEEDTSLLPAGLEAGDTLSLIKVDPIQHFTQPPPRYTDASLVKELEEEGIGRPSTYAPIISTILDRGYVERREGRFFPTDLGMLVNGLLVEHFQDVMNIQFTAQMEGRFDEIEAGTIPWTEVLRTFHDPFSVDMEKARADMRNVKAEMETVTDIPCEKCGKIMIVRWGRHGQFLACSGYPECRNAKSFTKDADGKIKPAEPEPTNEKCPTCGSPMVIRSGRFGRFMACEKYPECKTTKSIPTEFACPKEGCGGMLVVRRSKRGRSFYGCNNYPKCDFVSWDPPVKEPCPKCGHVWMSERKLKMIRRVVCPKPGCGHEAEHALETLVGTAVAETGPGGGLPPPPADPTAN